MKLRKNKVRKILFDNVTAPLNFMLELSSVDIHGDLWNMTTEQ
jgi:hypothetical protein